MAMAVSFRGALMSLSLWRTFLLFLWLCGCLVLEGGVPCLVHGMTGAKYGGQPRAVHGEIVGGR